MSYYKKLNLPSNPLKDSKHISKLAVQGGYTIMSSDILSNELIDIFDSLNLKVKMVVVFGSNNKKSVQSNRLIHTDLIFDETCENNWRKLVGGINWEIEGSTNTFYWYDLSKLKECYPDDSVPLKYQYLNGIHYGHRFNVGVPDSAVLLDKTNIDGATLVRTEVPHVTMYENQNTNRVGISVRFYEEDFNYSWDLLVKRLEPFIK